MARPDVMTGPSHAATRERRVVTIGAVIVAAALLLTYAVLPFARHWAARDVSLDTARSRLRYVQALVGRSAQLETSARDAEQLLASQPQRAIHARSTTLAASALQSLLQDAADASHVVVTRLEVAPDGDATNEPAAATAVPATMSAYGDIVGVTAFLDLLARGPRVVIIDKMVMQRNAALLGAPDVVQVTMTVRAPVLSSSTSGTAAGVVAGPAAADDPLITTVVNGNVFSATRRAPSVRFTAPGQASSDMPAMSATAETAPSATTDSLSLPRLSGIVTVDGERRALVQLTASDGAPHLFGVGDVHAGFRIVRIGPDQVVLASRAGTRTLRLSSRATPDSLENLP